MLCLLKLKSLDAKRIGYSAAINNETISFDESRSGCRQF